MEKTNSIGDNMKHRTPDRDGKTSPKVVRVVDIIEELPDGAPDESEDTAEPTQVLDSFEIYEDGKETDPNAEPLAVIDIVEEMAEDVSTTEETIEPASVLDDSTESVEPEGQGGKQSTESIDIIDDPDDSIDDSIEPVDMEVVEEPPDETEATDKTFEEETAEVAVELPDDEHMEEEPPDEVDGEGAHVAEELTPLAKHAAPPSDKLGAALSATIEELDDSAENAADVSELLDAAAANESGGGSAVPAQAPIAADNQRTTGNGEEGGGDTSRTSTATEGSTLDPALVKQELSIEGEPDVKPNVSISTISIKTEDEDYHPSCGDVATADQTARRKLPSRARRRKQFPDEFEVNSAMFLDEPEEEIVETVVSKKPKGKRGRPRKQLRSEGTAVAPEIMDEETDLDEEFSPESPKKRRRATPAKKRPPTAPPVSPCIVPRIWARPTIELTRLPISNLYSQDTDDDERSVSCPKRSFSKYKRGVPDEFWLVKYRIQPVFVSVHEIKEFFRTRKLSVLERQLSWCQTCKARKKSREPQPTTTHPPKVPVEPSRMQWLPDPPATKTGVSMLINPVLSKGTVLIRITQSGTTSSFVMNKKAYLTFLERIKGVTGLAIPTNKTVANFQFPAKFDWKRFLPPTVTLSSAQKTAIAKSMAKPKSSPLPTGNILKRLANVGITITPPASSQVVSKKTLPTLMVVDRKAAPSTVPQLTKAGSSILSKGQRIGGVTTLTPPAATAPPNLGSGVTFSVPKGRFPLLLPKSTPGVKSPLQSKVITSSSQKAKVGETSGTPDIIDISQDVGKDDSVEVMGSLRCCFKCSRVYRPGDDHQCPSTVPPVAAKEKVTVLQMCIKCNLVYSQNETHSCAVVPVPPKKIAPKHKKAKTPPPMEPSTSQPPAPLHKKAMYQICSLCFKIHMETEVHICPKKPKPVLPAADVPAPAPDVPAPAPDVPAPAPAIISESPEVKVTEEKTSPADTDGSLSMPSLDFEVYSCTSCNETYGGGEDHTCAPKPDPKPKPKPKTPKKEIASLSGLAKAFKCEACGKSYVSKESLKRHVCGGRTKRSVSGVTQPHVFCNSCLISYPSGETHVCKDFCKVCQKPVSPDKTHVCRKKSRVSITKCQNCEKFVTEPHVCTGTRFKCAKCSFTSYIQTEYAAHTCSKPAKEVFRCNMCPKMFSKQEFLDKHQTTLCPKNKLPFPCTTCKAMITVLTAKSHVCPPKPCNSVPSVPLTPPPSVIVVPNSEFRGGDSIKCRKCKSLFSTWDQLKVHDTTVH